MGINMHKWEIDFIHSMPSIECSHLDLGLQLVQMPQDAISLPILWIT